MRISDWSSDVCSSDLAALPDMVRDGANGGFAVFAEVQAGADLSPVALGTGMEPAQPGRRIVRINGAPAAATAPGEWLAILRSEERRGGKECVSTCRSRWSASH